MAVETRVPGIYIQWLHHDSSKLFINSSYLCRYRLGGVLFTQACFSSREILRVCIWAELYMLFSFTNQLQIQTIW
ncbi:hypothetical protein LOK49_LG08G01169 [Camellia lanceoleosa]|uniref:Uncharacterized protein n=1 Tax=Camellia lanceoleosa TaxID=1840588 RepID=A0ACC0GXE3_9ERIC|nr:hypothetical protein LOK49_LG08G01169 [Camellia lanceoleosa]